MPERRRIPVHRVADTDLLPLAEGAHAREGEYEVVKLPDVERAIDEREDELRWANMGRRALQRLITSLPDYLPDEPLHIVVLRLVEEVEHLRKLREEDEVVVDAPTVSATFRQWVEEELIHLRQLGTASPEHRLTLNGELAALQRMANRLDAKTEGESSG